MSEPTLRRGVAVRDRASGRYLGVGPRWSDDPTDALVLDEAEAVEIGRRFLCEPVAIELVTVERRAVA